MNIHAQLTSLWGYPSAQISSTSNIYSYQVVANYISYPQNTPVSAVEMCLSISNVNAFSLDNDLKMGVGFKSVTTDNTITNNIVYCGNNVCNGGETASNLSD